MTDKPDEDLVAAERSVQEIILIGEVLTEEKYEALFKAYAAGIKRARALPPTAVGGAEPFTWYCRPLGRKALEGGRYLTDQETADWYAAQPDRWEVTPLYAHPPAQGWRDIKTAPRDGTRVLLAKIVGHPDHDTALWWAVAGYWSDRWNNWNDGVEPSGLAGPTHWLPISAVEERAIVDRIWGQLGRPSYDELAGRSIYDLIDELKARGGAWQPIETAVRDSKARLVWCPDRKNIYVVCWDDYLTQWVHFGGNVRLNEPPSRWMPLPPPPAQGGEDD